MDNKKKKVLIIVGICLAIILIVGVCLVVFGNKEEKNKKEIQTTLAQLGKNFYEDYYYPSQEKMQKDVKEYLAKFEKTGLRINIENLSKISKTDTTLLDKLVNTKTKEKCDYNETYIIIYPKAEYGKTDYTVESKIVCGFSDEEKKETPKVEQKQEQEDTKTAEETKTETKTAKKAK